MQFWLTRQAFEIKKFKFCTKFSVKEKATQGVGVIANQAKFTTEEQENFSQERVFLGSAL